MAKKYSSFAFTVSTKESIQKDSDIEKYITDWVRDKAYGMAIIEESKNGKFHAHGQIFTSMPTTVDSIRKRFRANILRLSPESNKHAVDIRNAYNDDFINNYLDKEDFRYELYRDLPEDTSKYYPSEEEQKATIAKYHAKDHYFHKLLEMWGDTELTEDTHIENLAQIGYWYYDQMYKYKTIPVIADPKRFKNNIKALSQYLYPDRFKSQQLILTAEDSEKYNNIQEFHKIT